jgi:hypothetical protein
MNHCTILLFYWQTYAKGVGITTLCVWAIFFFYDYFIRSVANKDAILENPSSKSNQFDKRTQIQTDKVEFDSMIQ